MEDTNEVGILERGATITEDRVEEQVEETTEEQVKPSGIAGTKIISATGGVPGTASESSSNGGAGHGGGTRQPYLTIAENCFEHSEKSFPDGLPPGNYADKTYYEAYRTAFYIVQDLRGRGVKFKGNGKIGKWEAPVLEKDPDFDKEDPTRMRRVYCPNGPASVAVMRELTEKQDKIKAEVAAAKAKQAPATKEEIEKAKPKKVSPEDIAKAKALAADALTKVGSKRASHKDPASTTTANPFGDQEVKVEEPSMSLEDALSALEQELLTDALPPEGDVVEKSEEAEQGAPNTIPEVEGAINEQEEKEETESEVVGEAEQLERGAIISTEDSKVEEFPDASGDSPEPENFDNEPEFLGGGPVEETNREESVPLDQSAHQSKRSKRNR